MDIGLRLDPDLLPASQETLAGATLHVSNRGSTEAELRFDVQGDVAGWAWVTPPVLVLPAGSAGVARVTLRPPRSTVPAAGPLPFVVSAVDGTGATTSVAGTLAIAPFVDLFATIEGALPGAGRHQLRLENRGNATCTVELAASSDGGEVVTAEPSHVTVDPGAAATAVITARPRAGTVYVEARSGELVVASVEVRPAPPPPRGWLPRAGVALVAMAGAAALAWVTVLGPSAPVEDLETADVVTPSEDCPAEGHLGSAVHGRADPLPPYGYSFLYADDEECRPARFDPCQPVHYVLNDTLAPPGATDDVREAFARLAAATGITYVDDGTTDEPVSGRRSPYQPERYGERWAPILVGWSALGTGRGADSAGDDIIVAGRGNPIRVGNVLVSGVLELNADLILDRATQATLPAGFGEGITRGRVLLHELGHVMGLGHAGNPAQLMYPELAEHTSSSARFGVGDATALRLIGREAGCIDDPPTPGPITG